MKGNDKNPTPRSNVSVLHPHRPSEISVGTTQSEELPGFAPYAPVVRAGHYDDLPKSLLPKGVNKDAIPGNPLQRSSSSFLERAVTPPSTPSEEEAGTVGFHFTCMIWREKRRHHVDSKFGHKKLAAEFGTGVLTLIIMMHIPHLILEIVYVASKTFREYFLLHYGISAMLFGILLVLSLILNYFTGIMRYYPYNLLWFCLKALNNGMIFMLVGCLIEWAFIEVRIFQYYTIPEDGNEAEATEKIYQEIVALPLIGTKRHTISVQLLFGILYALLLMVLLLVLVKRHKITFFGPMYPFITYTISFTLVLVANIVIISEGFWNRGENTIWELVQSIVGPLIGCLMVEMFIVYLRAVLSGKLCPIKFGEYLYAAAHY